MVIVKLNAEGTVYEVLVDGEIAEFVVEETPIDAVPSDVPAAEEQVEGEETVVEEVAE